MVYPPVQNPLTGKTVGPDRSRILARARIAAWDGTKAHLRLVEITEPLPAGSVFADPHLEEYGSYELVEMRAPHRWWALAGPPMASAPALSPQVTTHDSISLKFHRGAFVVTRERMPVRETPPPAPGNDLAAPTRTIEMRITDFVIAHHKKASAGDVIGEVDDYAEEVDYFKKRRVPKAMILADQQNYHGARDTEEKVHPPITIFPIANGLYQVSYALQSDIVEPDKAPYTVHSKVMLTIRATPNGLRIISHDSEKLQR